MRKTVKKLTFFPATIHAIQKHIRNCTMKKINLFLVIRIKKLQIKFLSSFFQKSNREPRIKIDQKVDFEVAKVILAVDLKKRLKIETLSSLTGYMIRN